ncbi:MAG TPA: glycoside hydrolase family 2 TIM barrel-domain containing protein, partial [Solirubrobacteraceae bacterium]|nr:glycoside hydrolase family 2 TIM barrel-domain containing protein [Solirubrobacteraceae bacterium]
MRARSRWRYALVGLAALAASLATSAAAEAPTHPAITAGAGERVALTSWTVREDAANRGVSLGWQRGGFAGGHTSVPSVMHPDAFSGRAGTRNYEGSVAWYQATLHATVAGTYALDFQSANFFAQVWVDGRLLGSHQGSYLPFELRTHLAAGAHRVVVRIDWRNPGAQSRAGFHRTWFNWGGIDGEVEARRIDASDLSEPTIHTVLGEGSARVTVSVRVRNEGPERTLTPEGSLVREDASVPLRFAPLTLEAGQTATATATATVQAPALWSPRSPSLYRLQLAVPGESTYVADVGLRQLTWRSGSLYINGTRLKLHGVTVQEDAPGHGDALTASDDDRLLSELRAIHANAVRAQHPLDPMLLERLDAAGIVVWQGIGPVEGAGNWFSNTPHLNAQAIGQARSAVAAERLHPSVIAWNLVDEVAGNGRDAEEVAYVQTLTRWLHLHDP